MTEAEYLRKGIQDYLDGNYGSKGLRKMELCKHGSFGWEPCHNCIDEHFIKLLAEAKDAMK
jgi:hypothetical protein